MSEKSKFWMKWGGNDGEKDFNMKTYDHTPTYNNDGVTLHSFVYEDEDGKQIKACFEAFKSYDSGALPVMGLKLLSMARCDSNQPIEVPKKLEEVMYGQALATLSENDADLLDEVPAW